MDNIIGKYVLAKWQHNSGFKEIWLRRINRKTKIHYVSDVQYYLLLHGKYKKMCENNNPRYGRISNRAFRMRIIDGKLIPQMTSLSNTDGKLNLSIVDDFKSLKCKYSYNELFDVDLRTVLDKDSRMLKSIISLDEERFLFLRARLVEKTDDLFGYIVEHLESLFNLPVYRVSDFIVNIDTIHELSKYSETAIHYHITYFGGNKPIKTRDENDKNRTISFWVFDDRVVFKLESGIGSW